MSNLTSDSICSGLYTNKIIHLVTYDDGHFVAGSEKVKTYFMARRKSTAEKVKTYFMARRKSTEFPILADKVRSHRIHSRITFFSLNAGGMTYIEDFEKTSP